MCSRLRVGLEVVKERSWDEVRLELRLPSRQGLQRSAGVCGLRWALHDRGGVHCALCTAEEYNPTLNIKENCLLCRHTSREAMLGQKAGTG